MAFRRFADASQPGVVRKSAAHQLDIPCLVRVKKERTVARVTPIKLRLQRTPTREAVFPSHRKERRCEFCLGVGLAKDAQSILC